MNRKIDALLKRFDRAGDVAADAASAVRGYAEATEAAPSDLARFARSVARELEDLARQSEELDEPGAKNVIEAGRLVCPAGDGSVHPESHQADPCATCGLVYHDACFYTKAHSCVRDGFVEERKGYGIKEAA